MAKGLGVITEELGLTGSPGTSQSETKLKFATPEDEIARKLLLRELMFSILGPQGYAAAFPQGGTPAPTRQANPGGLATVPPAGLGGVANQIASLFGPQGLPFPQFRAQPNPTSPPMAPVGLSVPSQQTPFAGLSQMPRGAVLEPMPGFGRGFGR